ncbi:hypothetical protein C3747_114g95 [Trypanosoma cruzi]|uniref:Uncharacterized protein n=2 Tax=Trypanosoma cruzi TaxID=5693 RepID=Q4D4E1_TRYCC|nr:hypothetical protein, conserved [Trypanosoma cruzi]EAN87389.1 hypothetical protein, conserved [Trypanosoma cruzi]PWV06519.1 hypothetical protein C3747_114g95 [Trypanosoma cruzi]|eukprot:XP_809240.1 hypothetical protein [Trypanosoma cruzi strain CL Brener]
MNDVQIGVLVAMCVVFVVVASVLFFLLRLWGCRRRTDRKRADADPPKGGEYVLHFIDFSGTPRSFDVRAMAITDARSLQSALAEACGLPDDTSLTLLCPNGMGQHVEMDLNQLVFPDNQLESRMRHTEEQPLLLSRELSDPQSTGTVRQLVEPSQQNYYNGIDVSYTRSSSCVKNAGDVSHGPETTGDVPSPIILPLCSRIGSATPVSIAAVRYVVQGSDTLLDKDAAAFVEEAMMGSTRRTVTLPCGARVIVLPSERAAWLLDDYDRNVGVPLIREAAEVVQYNVGNMGSAQWRPYKHPIFLPPGRWCICAESSTADHRFVETASRVFTVDIVPRKR